MKARDFIKAVNVDFFTGVPDSQLKEFCAYLLSQYGIDKRHHIIAANEGNSVGIAAGYYMSTGKIPLVYMQNSGEGNIINPVASLINRKVYGIPVLFLIGWRGEPGVHDEPQHIYQGEITLRLLDDMGIRYYVIDQDTSAHDIERVMSCFHQDLLTGNSVAFVVKKNAFEKEEKLSVHNGFTLKREEAIRHIVTYSGDDPIISTTGKASRELFEIREANKQSHERDFLTVGSMGHASSIALGISTQHPEKRIWCIDGDGSLLMHMGSIAVIGAHSSGNMVHIVLNNEAHDTVGGQPTVAHNMDIIEIAKACGYKYAVRVGDTESLDKELIKLNRGHELSLLEIDCALGARSDLGRPTTTPIQNRDQFISFLNR